MNRRIKKKKKGHRRVKVRQGVRIGSEEILIYVGNELFSCVKKVMEVGEVSRDSCGCVLAAGKLWLWTD
ncbi:hypothetical protein, partial [Pseudomonas syringae group genomosp. 7]|uniref:hypothetical protein n=1 Tax=Pseudomonas syringae group genomosp. 7 TaxID=251699 RepID=UPI00377035AA